MNGYNIAFLTFSFFLISISVSCVSDDYTFHTEVVNNVFKDDDFDTLLVIPRVGCDGCIGQATEYAIINYIEKQRMLFVFTDIEDIKWFNIKYGEFLHNVDNVFIDTLNIFSNQHIKSIYPQFWQVENKRVINTRNFN